MNDHHHRAARDFVDELVGTGLALSALCADLVEELPDEQPAEVLLDMVAGSIRPVTDAAGPDVLANATALISASLERVLGDLRLSSAGA